MDILNLSEAAIRSQSTPQSFERGQDYYRSGMVFGVIRRGDQIVARVLGSGYDPYTVTIDLNPSGLTDATCNCPYDWGGWCKHIIATLLVCLHQPGRIEERPVLADFLAGLDRAQLHGVLVGLVKRGACSIDRVEREVALAQDGTAALSLQYETVDQVSIRRQVHTILHSLDHMRRSEAYWHVENVVDQVREMLLRVDDWVSEREMGMAFAFLEAVTEAYIADWTVLDDSDGDPSGFFSDLGDAWERVTFAAHLSPAERRKWITKIVAWQEQLHGYELGGPFELALMELEEDEDEP